MCREVYLKYTDKFNVVFEDLDLRPTAIKGLVEGEGYEQIQ